MRLRDLLTLCRAEMAARGLPDAPREAEILVSGVTGIPRSRLLVEADRDVGDPDAALRAGVARRAAGEPLQYILGAWDFFGRTFDLSRDTLIPRPETEGLVEAVLDAWRGREKAPPAERRRGGPTGRFLDVGTGSGAIAVTLAAELPGIYVVATDLALGALRTARANAGRHGVGRRVLFLRCHLASALKRPGRFDVVVSNPPYVAEGAWERLPPEVRDFEPPLALRAGPEGLSVLREIVGGAGALLAPAGELFCEIGADQGEAVARLPCGDLRFLGISRDLAGRDRYARWRRDGEPWTSS